MLENVALLTGEILTQGNVCLTANGIHLPMQLGMTVLLEDVLNSVHPIPASLVSI